MDAYLKSLQQMPSPYLVKGALSESAKRGKDIFNSAGCADCHSGEYYTNLNKYNLGTGLGREKDWEFDTPTLRETWRSGPYLHDGRAATMLELFTKYNAEDKHGVTSTLTEAQMADLVEYLLSL